MNLVEALHRALSLDYRALERSHFERQRAPASFDLIAIGKAASAHVSGLLDAWGEHVASALVVLPDGVAPPPEHPRLTVLRGSHPLPDERSVAAGEAALALARAGEGSELRVHVSGGASSLVAAPIDGLTLATLRELTQALLVSGADVRAINVVRRHVSRAHGGRIARAAWPRPVVARIVSDVIDGAPYDVGSGPASPDPTTVDDARSVLAHAAPSFRGLPLAESLKPVAPEARAVRGVIAFDPASLALAFAAELEREGLRLGVLPPSTRDVADLAAEYAELARTLSSGEAVVRSAEPALRIRAAERGIGGRCTHLAALVSRDLPAGVTFLAAASDGVDGTSGTGGAIVTAESFRACPRDLEAAIAAFDTGTLHRARATALAGKPTGVNFADLHALVRS